MLVRDPTIFLDFSFFLGVTHRVAEERFLYFVLGVHCTAQLFHRREIVFCFVSEVMGTRMFIGKAYFDSTQVL
jgi:hypothetical protein